MEPEFLIRDGEAALMKAPDQEYFEVPESYGGFPVTEIGERAFRDNREMKAVTLPGTLRRIGSRAFYGCHKLGGIAIPDGVTRLLDYTFFACWKLEKIHLPDRLEELGNCCFSDCISLTEVYLPDSLERVGSGIFQCSQLRFLSTSAIRHLPNMISEHDQFLELEMRDGGEVTRLILPEYMLETTAMSQTKEFKTVVYGAGEKCRACVSSDGIDYARYDELFPRIIAEETEKVVLRVAFDRLRYPVRMSEKARARYTDYLTEHMPALLESVMKNEDISQLEFLQKGGFLEGRLDSALALASKYGNARAAALLMSAVSGKRKKKSFEL